MSLPITSHYAELLDALNHAGVVVAACIPAGLISPLACGETLYHVLKGLDKRELFEALSIDPARLKAEAEALGSETEAIALLIDEAVRERRMAFNELLIHYLLPNGTGQFSQHFVTAPSALVAATRMLEQANRKHRQGSAA